MCRQECITQSALSIGLLLTIMLATLWIFAPMDMRVAQAQRLVACVSSLIATMPCSRALAGLFLARSAQTPPISASRMFQLVARSRRTLLLLTRVLRPLVSWQNL